MKSEIMKPGNNHHNCLVEILVEELPPKALKKLGEAFANALFESLKTQGLTSENSIVTQFATPRRLAAHISHIAIQGADVQIAQKLMPASVGLDASGKATPALLKKLQSLSADESAVADLRKENDVLFLDALQTGAKIADALQKALDEALAKLPIPKVMTYQLADGWTSVNFVRPAQSLIALHGKTAIPINALGLTASNKTLGHRFESKAKEIVISHPDQYAEQLKDEGCVIASFDERRAEIVRQLSAAATKEKLTPIDDDALLDEVTALVERPNVLLGQFEKEFLEVPQECLILTMKANQKYFPLLDANGKLTNKFLIVSNISPKDPSAVIQGNERVVRPRLADAKFFFDQDRKKTLESRIAGLDKVVYHNKLGSQGERNARVVAIAKAIAAQLGDANLVTKVELAAHLSKTDLITDMVGEFPELQGIMGRYYAQHEGLDNDVAFAIEDHYKPRFAGDELPRNQVGVILALADKLETLVGLFSIGEKPTGDKDPFGLRRHTLGVIRMLIECNIKTDLSELLASCQTIFKAWYRNSSLREREAMERAGAKITAPPLPLIIGEESLPTNESIHQLIDFIYERLSGAARDLGATVQEADAVLSLRPKLLLEIPKRLEAVNEFTKLPEAPALAAANKRVGNILKKHEAEIVSEVSEKINASLLKEPAEKALNDALCKIKPQADKLFEVGDYTASLQALAALKTPIDNFFDNVMVNADDVDLKNNRLALLNQLHQAMNRVADLSKLAS